MSTRALGGYASKQCPTRVYRDIVEDASAAEPPSPGAIQRMEAGVAFETEVGEAFAAALGGFGNLDAVDPALDDDALTVAVAAAALSTNSVAIPACDRTIESKTRRERLTLAALRAKVAVIWNARLPMVNGRIGEPDVIVDGYPVDVKWHKSLTGTAATREWRVSTLDSPSLSSSTLREIGVGRPHKDDNKQLAHYIHMLRDLGFAPAASMGAIIGKDMNIVWRTLDTPEYAGRKSALDAYDAGFTTAQAVAAAAAVAPENGPLIPPVWKDECKECPWKTVCKDELTANDHISLLPGITPSRVATRKDTGVERRSVLARLDIHADAKPDEVDQARVSIAGVPHRKRNVGTVTVPRGTFELDIDIEDADGRCYLIGVADTWRRRERGTLRTRTDFHAFCDWTRTDDGEARAFAEFWKYLMEKREQAARNRWGFRCYHYTDHETHYFRRLADKHAGVEGVPTRDEVDEFLASDAWIDLHKTVVQQVVWPTENHQLKTIARHLGFSWRDEQPGGANSMAWYDLATLSSDEGTRAANRERVLEYNEDDVRATLHIREWLEQAAPTMHSVANLDRRFQPRRRSTAA